MICPFKIRIQNPAKLVVKLIDYLADYEMRVQQPASWAIVYPCVQSTRNRYNASCFGASAGVARKDPSHNGSLGHPACCQGM